MSITSIDLTLHELIQAYFDHCYGLLTPTIKTPISPLQANEIYGELCYYSVVKLLKHLNLTIQDHFLDIGSGLGKIVFQIFLITEVNSVTGVEINKPRHEIACSISNLIKNNLPALFNHDRNLYLINDDVLNINLSHITVIDVCSTVFSFELLQKLGNKINNHCSNVKTVVSLRKLPELTSFRLAKKIFLQVTWDLAPCYLYTRI